MRGGGAHGVEEFRGPAGGPIVRAYQNDVDAAGIAGEEAGGVEQFLEHLLVGGEAKFGRQREFAEPEGEAGLQGLGSECGANRDEQLSLY